MTIREMAERIDAVVYAEPDQLDEDLSGAFGSDMMSDVLAFVKDKAVLLTGLMNPQVIRTAEMMDIETVIFVRGKKPDDAIVGMSKMKDIVVMTTEYPLYIACHTKINSS